MPDISVVIPNYNNAIYLENCLDSVINQTFKKKEILLLDDCSIDDSPQIIKRYARQYPNVIRPFFNTRNVGVARNRHRGILAAQGRYLTTLDSDDQFADAEKLEREHDLIRQHEDNNATIIAFSNVMQLFNDGSEQLVGTGEDILEGNIFISMLLRKCFIPRDFLFKRELYFEVGGYNPSYTIYEDWNLKLKLAKKYCFYYTGITGVIYRRHGHGLSNSPPGVHQEFLRRSFLEMVADIEDQEAVATYTREFEEYLAKVFGVNRSQQPLLARLREIFHKIASCCCRNGVS